MSPASDITTRELSAARLRLADGLTFTPFFRRGRAMYRVATHGRKAFFELGREEVVFLSLLDGRTTVAEAVSSSARALGSGALTEREATAIAQWLLDGGLAHPVESAVSPNAVDAPQRGSPSAPGLNPLWLRIPLIRSDGWLDGLSAVLGWVHSAPAIFAWLAVVLLGATQLLGEWARFRASAQDLLIPDDWLWTGLLWCVLKALHEVSHALACRRYGGAVSEMGITLILFAPVAYVDVSSSWAFESRRQRMHVAIAGVYADFFVAALAALVWAQTDSVVLTHVLSRTIWLCTLTTVLFNLNPLVRSDGYYLLCDACDVPNLSPKSRMAVGRLLRKLFFGSRASSQAEPCGALQVAYGVASLAWSSTTMSALVVGAAAWLPGVGLLAAGAIAIGWLGPSIIRAIGVVRRQLGRQPDCAARFAGVSVAVVAAGAALLFLVPWPAGRTAPFVVDFARPAVIRADGPAFVHAVHTQDGAHVSAGDLLLELRNANLDAERREVAAQVAGTEAQRRAKLNDGDTAAAQVAEREIESLRRRLDELSRQLASFEIRAPISGRVVARDLPHLHGTWCELGKELLTIAPDDLKEFRASVSQEDAEFLREAVGESFPARFPARAVARVVLERLAPRASVEPLHPALVAPLGGPLAARPVENASPAGAGFQLLEPCFCATFGVDAEFSRQVRVGETGRLHLHGPHVTLYELVERKLRKWLAQSESNGERRRATRTPASP